MASNTDAPAPDHDRRLCGSEHDDGRPDRFHKLQTANSAEANTTTDDLIASTNSRPPTLRKRTRRRTS